MKQRLNRNDVESQLTMNQPLKNVKTIQGQVRDRLRSPQGMMIILLVIFAVNYNTTKDDKNLDDWCMCVLCEIWAHESCAEENGVVGDDGFFAATV